MQIIPKIYKILLLLIMPLFAISSSSATGGLVEIDTLSTNMQMSDIVLVVTLIAGLLTILTVAKGLKGNNTKKDEYDELKTEYNKLSEYVNSLSKLDVENKIHTLESDLTDLDDTVNGYMKQKLSTLVENFTILETKVSDLTKHFESFNQDRKDENLQLRSEINTLRENIREDINDVKGIIIKLMMALKTEDE